MQTGFSSAIAVLIAAITFASSALADPLPSWRAGPVKAAITDFVNRVTDAKSPDYVTPSRRVATFDNDGNLWAEQPMYFQLIYALDRLRARAEADPSILTSDALKAGAAGDMKALFATGEKGLLEVIAVSHSGMSVEAFSADVADWLDTARHPKTGLPYSAMVYQPMLELLSYLRDNGFQTWIVSGGGVHFMRVFAEKTYGVKPWQVIGSLGESEFDDATMDIMKTPGIAFVDDKGGKPVAIDRNIGLRPILASGNSDGDMAMLQYATAGDGPRMGLILHHTDAARETAYDRDSAVGRLDKALDAAPGAGWIVIDMARDWRVVFPSQLN